MGWGAAAGRRGAISVKWTRTFAPLVLIQDAEGAQIAYKHQTQHIHEKSQVINAL